MRVIVIQVIVQWHGLCNRHGQTQMPTEKSHMNNDEKPNRKATERNFESEVLRAKKPVLVAFFTTWSQPCQVLKPVLDEVAAACAGKVDIVELNADDDPRLGLDYAIQFIPTLLVFVDGTIRARLVGTASAEAILAELRSALGRGDFTKTRPSASDDEPR